MRSSFRLDKMKKAAMLLLLVSIFSGSMPGYATTPLHEKKFANCAALNKVYPGGVSKSKTVVNKGGQTKKTPTVDAKVYAENRSKDRDGDGIACEK